MTTATEHAAGVEEWVRGFEAGWRDPRGPEEFADHFIPMLDPEIRMIQPQIPTIVGHEAFRRDFVHPTFAVIPDLHGTVTGWAADGELIFIDLVLEGTVGGKPLRMETVDRVTLRDGLALERRAFLDPSPLLAAVATRPRAWTRFGRAQLAALRARRPR